MIRRSATLLILVAVAIGCLGFFGRPAKAQPQWIEWTIPYEGRTIRVHVIAPPDTPPPWPLAMILHGASGLGRGYMIFPIAAELANKGVAAAIVRYYDGMPKSIKRKQSPRWFRMREELFDHVVTTLLKRREVKGDKLGVFGYSLGGFHSIGLAATDRRIAAAVSLAGGLSGHLKGSNLRGAAPLMLVHGTRDRIVPYRRSRHARGSWRQFGRPVELVTLRGVGHVPAGSTREKAFTRAADFLVAHMRQVYDPPVPKPPPGETIPVRVTPEGTSSPATQAASAGGPLALPRPRPGGTVIAGDIPFPRPRPVADTVARNR